MDEYRRGNVAIAYYTKGEGQPVILLHGFPDSSAIWKPQADALIKAGFKVIVPDLRGMGKSSKPASVKVYALAVVAQDVFALADHLSIYKFHLVGHDFGAAMAWHIANAKSSRVLSLAVLSVGHPVAYYVDGGNKQREASWYALLFKLPEAEEVVAANNWALWRKLLQEERSSVVEDSIARLSQDGALTAGLNWYRANAPAAWVAMVSPPPDLQKLKLPVLGVWSSKDRFCLEEQMAASGKYVEDGMFTYKRIDGVSHWMQIEAPDVVSELLVDFLSSRQIASSL